MEKNPLERKFFGGQDTKVRSQKSFSYFEQCGILLTIVWGHPQSMLQGSADINLMPKLQRVDLDVLESRKIMLPAGENSTLLSFFSVKLCLFKDALYFAPEFFYYCCM